MRRQALWFRFGLIALLAVPLGHSSAQTPNAPAASWQDLDLSKLDRDQCEKLKGAAACPEGDAGRSCRSTKLQGEIKCSQLTGEWSVFDYLPKGSKEKFIEYASLIIVGIMGLGLTNLLAWLRAKNAKAEAKQSSEEVQKSNEQIAKLESRVLDPFFDRPTDFEQYATNMILIGEGGSGKTTILHALCGTDEAKPDVATIEMSTYTLVHEINVEKNGRSTRRLVRIYSDDYEGQSWTTGSQNQRVKERQQVIKSSSLVVVVDLIAPGTMLQPAERRDKPQLSRVREQLQIYNEPAIQNLAKLLGANGQIILFINKIDLIYPVTDERIQEAKESYRRLIDKLRDIRGVRLRVLVGSAATGLGVVGYDDGNEERKSLFKLVLDHAERLEVDDIRALQDG